jgi:hypothetical protein
VKVMAVSSSTSEDALESARLKLCQKINSWRKTQLDHYPRLRDELDAVNLAEPENERLMIPSQFSDAHRRSLGIQELAKVERSLREGQAHDALDKVQLAIQMFNYNMKFKVDNIRGQRPSTRTEEFLASLSKDKVSAADKYRRVRTALLRLGLSEGDLSLQPLLNDQLWCKNENSPAAQGDAKREDPWYWMVGRPSGLSPREEAEWQIESKRKSICSYDLLMKVYTAYRVKWFRARAARNRAQEEVEILEAEFRRAHRSFLQMSKIWMELATGKRAGYAFKQSAMYNRLAIDCKEAFEKVCPTSTSSSD